MRKKKKKEEKSPPSEVEHGESLSSQPLMAFQRRRFLSDFKQIQVVDINTIERRRKTHVIDNKRTFLIKSDTTSIETEPRTNPIAA